MRALAILAAFLASGACAEVPAVATDIPPVHSLVALVMGDLGAPALLMERGGNAHDYQLRPSQARALGDAALLFWVGPEMTPWLDRIVQGGIPGRAVGLLHQPGTLLRKFADGDHGAEGGDAAADDHSGTDPHAWLDPDNARRWIGVIAAELARADPEHAAAYADNAARAIAAVDAADAEAAAMLLPGADMPRVVFHDAYGYFFDHFGLAPPSALAEGDAAAPGAARLSALRGGLSGQSCIYPEAGHDPGLIEALALGTPGRIGAPLDPEGRDLAPGPDLYAALVVTLARALSACGPAG